MPHAIRARFKPSPSDFVRATLAFYFTQRSILLLMVVSLLFVALAAPISLIYLAQGSRIAIFILVIVFGYLLIAIATLAAPLMRIHRIAGQDERMQAETTWSVEADRIEVRNRFEKTELVWGMFDRLIAAQGYLILVYADNKRQFTFLPKRAFQDPADGLAFQKLAREKLA
ncbi:YcxB-like protein [Longilinea arvoryzae]|uniref:YcxB-like protein n=1 Tax=Longilinea arvoryzae TaxID=360412 RepID=A0A0S7BI30_9CHLR|nr:YcxB family protein [Longilinea arvoryzae]GAP13960.1 YcxB-like protein [Longilinea arvoryzae]